MGVDKYELASDLQMMKRLTPVLEVSAPSRHAEAVSWALADAGALAVEERDASTMTREAAGRVLLIAGFESEAVRARARRVVLAGAYDDIAVVEVDEAVGDWQTRWREFFKPVVLDRVQVVTPWMALPRKDRIPIVIDPGQAFGTGGHETTKLILRMLERRAAIEGLPGRVLDVGTGSGILAIAVRMLGAAEVLGVDIDAESIAAFEENARRNRLSDGLSCRLGSAADLDGRWPLVLANLQLDIFESCAGQVAARVETGGELLVSGILTEQVAPLAGLWSGFEVAERLEAGEWAALALRRLP